MTTLRELGALLAEGVPTPRPDPRQPRMERRDYGYPPVKTLPETDEERRKRLGYSAASPQFFEQPTTLANLGETLGDPRGPNPTLAQAMAMARAAPGPNGPMPSDEQIQAYLRMTGQIYPPLTTRVNPAGWEAFLAQAPESLNIEDRRGINRRR